MLQNNGAKMLSSEFIPKNVMHKLISWVTLIPYFGYKDIRLSGLLYSTALYVYLIPACLLLLVRVINQLAWIQYGNI